MLFGEARRFSFIIIAGLIAAGAIAFIISTSQRSTSNNSEDGPLSHLEVEGVLGVNPEGVWYVLNDATHQSVNVESVSQTTTYIVVSYRLAGSKVRSSFVTPDASLAKERIMVGASVGLSEMWISLSSEEEPNLNPSSVTDRRANIWFSAKLWK